MIIINSFIEQEIIFESEKGYPYEVCGIILGLSKASNKEALLIYPSLNISSENKNKRYIIEPKRILEAQNKAKENSLEIIGFYHSHPEHPPIPSEYDRQQAWHWYSYLIISIINGKAKEMKAWILSDEDNKFMEEEILKIP